MLIYEAYPHYDTNKSADHLQIRFRKVPHGLILREKKASGRREEDEEPPDENTPPDHIQQLRYFEDVSGYAGVSDGLLFYSIFVF